MTKMTDAEQAGGKYGLKIGTYTGLPVAIYNGLELVRLYFAHQSVGLFARAGFLTYGLVWFVACLFAGRLAAKALAMSTGGMPLGSAVRHGIFFGLTALGLSTVGATVGFTIITGLGYGFSDVFLQFCNALGMAVGAVITLIVPVLIGGVILGFLAHKPRVQRSRAV